MTRCAGCNRVFEPGDRYIVDTPSGFMNSATDLVVDDIVAGIFGGSAGEVRFCESCTEPGGKYEFEVWAAKSIRSDPDETPANQGVEAPSGFEPLFQSAETKADR